MTGRPELILLAERTRQKAGLKHAFHLFFCRYASGMVLYDTRHFLATVFYHLLGAVIRWLAFGGS